jgi:hypothetical protein
MPLTIKTTGQKIGLGIYLAGLTILCKSIIQTVPGVVVC